MLNFRIRNFCSKVNHSLCLTSLVAKECSGTSLFINKRDLLHTGIVRKNIFVLLLSVHSTISLDVRNKYVYRKHEILIFCVTIKISCFMVLKYIFPANSRITSYRHILLDGNDYYNSNSLKTLSVNRTFINFFSVSEKICKKIKVQRSCF